MRTLLVSSTSFLAFALPVAAAEVASTDLSVTATVLDTCTVSAPTGLVFASVNSGADTGQSVQGTIAVVCTASKTGVSVNLEGGENMANGKRHMKSPANDLLPYVITSDAGHAQEVAVNGTLFSGALNAVTPNLIPVYGKVPAGSYAAGVYTDTVRVTLNY